MPPIDDQDAQRCRRHGLPMADAPLASQWTVRRTETWLLELSAPSDREQIAVTLDLRSGPLARRLRTAARDQPLPKALGLHRRTTPLRVVDATAGLGRDALLLAQLGCEVTAIERVPALAVLLDDGAERADLTARLHVHCGDAIAWLDAAAGREIDVVYLDPMFPVQGSAQVKKDMQVCRLLAGPPVDTALLWHRACAVARERVVCKRHPHELPLAGPPSFCVDGERVRFDVYLRPGATSV